MFGIDDILLASLIGGGAGALTSKKDPLKGALIGAGLGAGGAHLAPGLLGAGGATAGIAPGATAATQGGLLAAQEAGLGMTGSLGWGGATTGIQGGLNSALGANAGAQTGGLLANAGGMMDKAKPVMEAAQMGRQMAQANDPPPAPAPSIRSSPPDLNGILQQGYQQQQYIMDDAERRRRLRQSYVQNMGRM